MGLMDYVRNPVKAIGGNVESLVSNPLGWASNIGREAGNVLSNPLIQAGGGYGLQALGVPPLASTGIMAGIGGVGGFLQGDDPEEAFMKSLQGGGMGALGWGAGDMLNAPSAGLMTKNPLTGVTTAARSAGRGGGIGGLGLPAIIAGQAGLGFLTNRQGQIATKPAMEARSRTLDLQEQALADPLSVPGLRARIRLDTDAAMRDQVARYGGMQGGAQAKALQRAREQTIRQGVGEYMRQLEGVRAGTAPEFAVAAQTGLTPLGAAGQAGQNALNNWAFLEVLKRAKGL